MTPNFFQAATLKKIWVEATLKKSQALKVSSKIISPLKLQNSQKLFQSIVYRVTLKSARN